MTGAHIEWEFCPFYRRWDNKRWLWSLWPIAWVLVNNEGWMETRDYYLTANDAAIALATKAAEYAVVKERARIEQEMEQS